MMEQPALPIDTQEEAQERADAHADFLAAFRAGKYDAWGFTPREWARYCKRCQQEGIEPRRGTRLVSEAEANEATT